MSKAIKPEDIGKAIAEELTIYGEAVRDGVNQAGEDAMQKLVQRTKSTAPVNARASHRHYKTLITSQVTTTPRGDKSFTWYVKPPGHRLTHLLVHGHATKDGGRTRADPFLQNALDDVLPEYENAVEEAVKDANT